MASVKLHYFDVRARGELIRMLMKIGGQEFEDIRVTMEEWPEYKKSKTPYGMLPFMEYNGEIFTQSVAMINFFARNVGMYGRSSKEDLRTDEVMGLYQEIWDLLIKAYYSEAGEEQEAKLQKKLLEEDLPKYFGFFQKLLNENGPKGFIVGEDLSLADLTVYDMMYSLAREGKYDAAPSFPDLQALKDRVEAHPRMKDYLAARPDTQF